MLQYAIAIAIIGASAIALLLVQNPFSGRERRYLWAGLGAYLFTAIFKIWLVTDFYAGSGDMMRYDRTAVQLSNYMQQDFGLYAPEVLRLLFQIDLQTTLQIFGAGGSTGSMSAALAIFYHMMGDSLYLASLFYAALSFFSCIAMYWALRQLFAAAYRPALLWASILLPSSVFWTAGYSKELFAIIGLNLAIFGLYHLFIQRGTRLKGAFFASLGIGLIAMFKGFMLIALIAAMGAYYYATRRRQLVQSPQMKMLTPFYLLIALAVAIGGFLLVGELFPRFSIEQMTAEIAHGQEAGARGGSAMQIGDPTQRSFAAQLAFAPVALINSLFRPFLFEAHNPVALANALETTVLTILLVLALKRLGLRRVTNALMNSPVLLGSLTIVIIMGIGVGLATANMGTLSRYRTPMMPFWVLIIGVLFTWSQQEKNARLTQSQSRDGRVKPSNSGSRVGSNP